MRARLGARVCVSMGFLCVLDVCAAECVCARAVDHIVVSAERASIVVHRRCLCFLFRRRRRACGICVRSLSVAPTDENASGSGRARSAILGGPTESAGTNRKKNILLDTI